MVEPAKKSTGKEQINTRENREWLQEKNANVPKQNGQVAVNAQEPAAAKPWRANDHEVAQKNQKQNK